MFFFTVNPQFSDHLTSHQPQAVPSSLRFQVFLFLLPNVHVVAVEQSAQALPQTKGLVEGIRLGSKLRHMKHSFRAPGDLTVCYGDDLATI